MQPLKTLWRTVATCRIPGLTRRESTSTNSFATLPEAMGAIKFINDCGCGGHPCSPKGHTIIPPENASKKDRNLAEAINRKNGI